MFPSALILLLAEEFKILKAIFNCFLRFSIDKSNVKWYTVQCDLLYFLGECMKVVIAIDSFKGSLSTFESGNAVSEGIKRVFTQARTVVCPLADGGEGTVTAIVSASDGRLVSVPVTGPLGDKVVAEYGILPERKTAVIEMSSAAGITLIEKDRRDPLKTTTYGVGELISHAIKEEGCREFIIGIGGSATNDGGVGMLTALG